MSAVLLAPGLEDGAPVRRFAFGGRVSTEDNQDPDASRNWQISRSRALIEPAGGIIVAEYFDIGQSRSLPWKRRPRAAQDLTSRRGPDSLAGRCYQLGGLVRCGSCGRLLESCWSNGKPAYRCRHGHTSASQPDPARPKNAYIREEQILPRLPALAILLRGPGTGQRRTGAGNRTRRGLHSSRGHQLPASQQHHAHLRPAPADPPGRHPRCRSRHHRPGRLKPATASRKEANQQSGHLS